MAESVMFWLLAEAFVVSTVVFPLYPIERAVTVQLPGVTLKEYVPEESVCATANPPEPLVASTNAPDTPVPESVTAPEMVREAAVNRMLEAVVLPETVTETGAART
jgi:hypothetical protein